MEKDDFSIIKEISDIIDFVSKKPAANNDEKSGIKSTSDLGIQISNHGTGDVNINVKIYKN